jgi:hypothetical protein
MSRVILSSIKNQWAMVVSPSTYPVFRVVTLIVPGAAALSASVTWPAEFVNPSVLILPPETATVAPLTAEPPLVTVKVIYAVTPLVRLDGLAIIASDCWPDTPRLILPVENPFFVAVAVIPPVLVELTNNMTWPFMLVIPLPLIAPVRVTVDSATALLPLVTVKVTKAGTPAVTVAGFDIIDNDCIPVDVIVVEPPA